MAKIRLKSVQLILVSKCCGGLWGVEDEQMNVWKFTPKRVTLKEGRLELRKQCQRGNPGSTSKDEIANMGDNGEWGTEVSVRKKR